MLGFAYARPATQHSLFILLLLSASTQAEVLFAPSVFTAAAETVSHPQQTENGLKKAALRPTAAARLQPASSPVVSPWISQPAKPPDSSAPQPLRLRF